jgi:hypothetical protein
LRYLERAYEMNPSPENMGSLARVLAESGEGGQSSQSDKLRALELAKKALVAYQTQNRSDDPFYALTLAQIAFGVEKIEEARAAVNALAVSHPDLIQTHYLLALIAAHDEGWTKAEDEIKLAQSLGLSAEAAQQFLDSGIYTRAQTWRYLKYSLYLVGAWVVGLALLFTLGKLFSNFTLRSIEEADPIDVRQNRERRPGPRVETRRGAGAVGVDARSRAGREHSPD